MLNTQVLLAKRAQGIPQADNFKIVQSPMPVCPKGGVLVRNLVVGVDPSMRGWVSNEQNYIRVEVGAVMRSYAIGEVLESDCADYRVGDVLCGIFNWQTFCAALPDAVLWKTNPSLAPPAAWLGVFGLPGLAAWMGLTDFTHYSPGETLVVSTAAGGVGGVAGQLARHRGLNAVGLTGSDTKVQLCLNEYGYHHAINYRSSGFEAALERACPNGIDIFFDNTGGDISDAVFERLNRHARIVQCGTAATASWTTKPSGPRRERDMLIKELTWRGFILIWHPDRMRAAFEDLQALYARGVLKSKEHVLDGLEQAPGAIAQLYAGENLGRLVIRL